MPRLRRALLWLPAAAILLYAGFVATLWAAQREFVFATNASGALTEPDTVVIPGAQRSTLTTPDGETLAAWYLAPRPGRPVYLFLHGKGGALHRHAGRWKRIAAHGDGVLAFSYRGYPGSTGSPSEAGLVTDARTAWDWLRAQGHAARDIVIHGLSLGSGVAVQLATQVPARALVLEAPYTAIVDVAAERYPFVPVHTLMSDQFLSREHIARVRVPILIAHGDRDSVIPFHHAERLYALAPEPKTFVRMPGSDHMTLTRDGLYERHLFAFVDALAAK